MQPNTSYFICATPRSGSKLLCESLKNTGLAGAPAEPYTKGNIPFSVKKWKSPELLEKFYHNLIETGTTPNGVFGIKVLWFYFEPFALQFQQLPGYEDYAIPDLLLALFPNIHYIWLTRRDKVRQAISLWKARQTSVWHVTAEQTMPSYKLVFDFVAIDRLAQFLTTQEVGWKEYFEQNRIEPLQVVYEELDLSYEQTAIHILDHLQLSHPSTIEFAQRELQKQADELTEQWVQDYYRCKQAASASK